MLTSRFEGMTAEQRTEAVIRDCWPDLTTALRDAGESRCHVDDVADMVVSQSYGGREWLDAPDDESERIKSAVRRFFGMSDGEEWIRI